jgi:hypothetical protein
MLYQDISITVINITGHVSSSKHLRCTRSMLPNCVQHSSRNSTLVFIMSRRLNGSLG